MNVCAHRWSLNGTPTHDWKKFMATKRKELKRLNDIHENMLDKACRLLSCFAFAYCSWKRLEVLAAPCLKATSHASKVSSKLHDACSCIGHAGMSTGHMRATRMPSHYP